MRQPREHSLDNHKARDREAHTWERSFFTFLKDHREAILQLRDNSSTWAEFHERLDELGIVLKERGNGLVFADNRDDVAAYEKASRVDRSLSKPALEKLYGPYEAIEKDRIGLKTDEDLRYKKEPLDRRLKKHPAWKLFGKQKKHRRWRGFLETMASQNAEVREALAIQQAYLSIFFGGKSPRLRQRQQRPTKGRSR